MDDQLKVNGIRLEPAEVEAALVSHPAIDTALVRVWTPALPALRADTLHPLRSRRRRARVELDDDGVCSVCHSFDEVEPQTEAWFRTEADLDRAARLGRARTTGDIDCLHLLSGGKDSTYALYQLVERGWRVHALTLDNGFISEGAKENVRRSVADLGITHEFATTDAMNEIFRDSLDRYSNVCQGCYKTIYTIAVARADELGIPVIVTGLVAGSVLRDPPRPAPVRAGPLRSRRDRPNRARSPTGVSPHAGRGDRAAPRTARCSTTTTSSTDRVPRLLPVRRRRPRRAVPVPRRARAVGPPGRHRPLDQLPDQRGRHPGPPPRAGLPQLRRALQLGRPARPQDARRGARRTRRRGRRRRGRRLLAEVGYEPKTNGVLTAWYQTVDGSDLDPDELRRHLRDLLPEHAVPSAFVRIDEMPLAASAKADVRSSRPRRASIGSGSSRSNRRHRSRPGCARSGPSCSGSSRSVSPTTSSTSVAPRSTRSRWSLRSTPSSGPTCTTPPCSGPERCGSSATSWAGVRRRRQATPEQIPTSAATASSAVERRGSDAVRVPHADPSTTRATT